MLKPSTLSTLRALAFGIPLPCTQCQRRLLSDSARLQSPSPLPPPKADELTPRNEEGGYTPKPLNRPIGLPKHPLPGENSGLDARSWGERRADKRDYQKHLQRRKELVHQFTAQSYFRDWSRLDAKHAGKSFFSPRTLFKAEHALFFPNFHGATLVAPAKDTTPVLSDKVSVVALYSSRWAENQVKTFLGIEENPELNILLYRPDGASLAQRVDVNIEENSLRAWTVKLFGWGGLKKERTPEQWERYFFLTRGVTDNIREAIGFLNSKVGYVYLLDGYCRIRWAGSGVAHEGEREALVRGVRKLVEEAKRSALQVPEQVIVRKRMADTAAADMAPPMRQTA